MWGGNRPFKPAAVTKTPLRNLVFQYAGLQRDPESLIGNGRKCYHSPRIMATTYPLAKPTGPTFEIIGKLCPLRSYPNEYLKSLLRRLAAQIAVTADQSIGGTVVFELRRTVRLKLRNDPLREDFP